MTSRGGLPRRYAVGAGNSISRIASRFLLSTAHRLHTLIFVATRLLMALTNPACTRTSREEWPVSTFTVRGYDDAWQVIDILRRGESSGLKIRFANCYIDIEASARIAGMASAQAFITLQRRIRRQFSWFKYGRRDGRLSDKDKAATEIRQIYHPNGCLVRYDITNALNAMAQAAEEWDEHGPVHAERTPNLFATETDSRVESWARTTRELGHHLMTGMTPKDKKTIALYGIAIVALIFLGGVAIKEGIKVGAERLDAYAQQQRFDTQEPMTVATYDGKKADLELTEVAKLSQELNGQRARTRMLVSDNIDMPFLRFVAAEAEDVRPALLRMAPVSGSITINGATMTAHEAKLGAKIMRKAAKAKRDNGGWMTEIVRAPSSGV
jgi:hypothetical protein